MKQLFKYLIPLVFAATSSPALTAQVETLYQIRQNHKMGYIGIWYPEDPVVVPAKYDLISEDSIPWNWGDKTRKSPYRLFEQDGKLGLLNHELNETLRARFTRIRPLTLKYFAVEEDSLFKLIRLTSDSTYEDVWPKAHYDDIQSFNHPDSPLDPVYFKVKVGKKWGIHENRGVLIIRPSYDTLVYAEYPGYFKAAEIPAGRSNSNDILWKLIGPGDKPVYPADKFKNVMVLGPQTYAVLRANEYFWKIWEDLDSTVMYKELFKVNGFAPAMGKDEFNSNTLNRRFFEYKSVSRLNKNLTLLKSVNAVLGRDTIYDSQTRKIWDPINNVRGFKPLDEDYILGYYGRNDILLVDMQGHIASKPLPFDSIATTGITNYYYVFNKKKIGLMVVKPLDTILLPCVYNHIYRIKDRHLGFSIDSSNYKLLTITDSCIVISSSFFNKIEYYPGDSIYGITDTLVYSLKLDACKYVEIPLAPEGRTPKPTFVDAQGKEFPKPNYDKPIILSNPQPARTSFVSVDKQVKLKLNQRKNLMLYDKSGVPLDNLEFAEVRFAYEELGKEILALYPIKQPVINEFTKCFMPDGGLSRVIFFDVANRQFWFKDDTIIGFRPFQTRAQSTTIVHANGNMYLIDRKGIRKENNGVPIHYPYIGNSIVNRTRFVVGGKMERKIANMNTEEDTYKLGEVVKVAYDLNLKRVNITQAFSSTNYLKIEPLDGAQARWGFMDENGAVLVEPQFEFADDFDEKDKTAFVYKLNPNKPKTDDIYNVYYGALNHSGKLFLPPIYNPVNRLNTPFEGFYLLAKDSTYTFYFDNKGRTIFENPTKITPFREGIAAFRNKQEQWGFVNKDGDTLVAPKYLQVSDSLRLFSEGLALVQLKSRAWAFVTASDSIACYLEISKNSLKAWESAKIYFSNGRCPVKRGNSWGYMDCSGRDTIPAIYMHVSPFEHNAAWVVTVDKKSKKRLSYAINTRGDTLAGPFEDMRAFNEYGLAPFKENGRWGVLDSSGAIKSTAIYDSIHQFVNGYAVVVNAQKKQGLINTLGEMVLTARFAQISSVSEARVKTRAVPMGDWTIWNLDKRPPVEIGTKFKKVTDFEGGVCVIHDTLVYNKNGELIYNASRDKGLILSEGFLHIKGSGTFQDGYGENVFVRSFSRIVTPFREGIAIVEPDKGNSLDAAINKRGVIIVPPKYKKLAQNRNGDGITVNPNRLFGIADKDGNIIIEPEYDRIVYYPDYKEGLLFRVEHGEKIGYGVVRNKKWTWIWHLQY